MDALTVSTIAALAVTGYGEVQGGHPSWAQRELHTTTNLVRVDPMAWAADYDCATTSFTSSERTAKAPLLHHDGLSEIAQLHSEDMAAHGFMDHTSWDGTSFSERVWPYYPGSTIAENVAWGYADNTAVVFEGWMCSAGHRANIMSAAFTDLGCGIQGAYYTQDFGGGAGQPHQPVAMGVHTPERPQGTVTFLATFDDSAPAWFGVETPTACLELERTVGSARRGGWSTQAGAEAGCVAYRFLWRTGGGGQGAMPSTGAYQYGAGCEPWVAEAPAGCDDDPELHDSAPWDSGEPCAPDDRNCDGHPDRVREGTLEACGCSAAGGTGAGLWLGMLALASLRRRGSHCRE
jgi:uncharacterized protein YkwD